MTITKGRVDGNTESAEGVNGEARAHARLLIAALTAKIAQLKNVLNTGQADSNQCPAAPRRAWA
jgi:hypothetical protein